MLGEAAIASNSNGIDVVSVSATAGRRSRLGITVLGLLGSC